eukprot:6200882-Pleurochrysis_carterae.AAC.3
MRRASKQTCTCMPGETGAVNAAEATHRASMVVGMRSWCAVLGDAARRRAARSCTLADGCKRVGLQANMRSG